MSGGDMTLEDCAFSQVMKAKGKLTLAEPSATLRGFNMSKRILLFFFILLFQSLFITQIDGSFFLSP